jgi:hypothetical protein
MRPTSRPLSAPAALLATVALLPACGGGDTTDATTQTTTKAATTTSAAGGQGQGGSAQGGAPQGGSAPGGSAQGGSGQEDIPATVVSENDKTFMEAETSVAVGPDGFVVVAFIAVQMSGLSTNGYRFSTDGGKTWAGLGYLGSPGGRVASDPVLTFDRDGNAWMSWVGYHLTNQGDATDMHVYVARADKGKTEFGTPLEVSDPKAGTQLDKPWITITPKGAILVTYAETSTGAAWSSRSEDGGATWKRAKVEAGATAFSNLLFPCSSDKGRVYVAYIHADGMGGGARLRWSDDDGASWPLANKTDLPAADDQPAFEDPTCAASGDEVWVSYGVSTDQFGTQQSSKLNGIRIAHSSNGGHAVDRRTDALDQAASKYAMHPQMVREAGGALDVIYYAGAKVDDPSGSFRRTRSTDGGVTWGPSETIQSPEGFVPSRSDQRWLGDYTGIAFADGALYASWADNTSGTSHIAFARVTPK